MISMIRGSIDAFIGKTLTGFLIIFGVATCLPIFLAYDIEVGNRVLFFSLLDYTPVSVPAIRHWGMMVFGIGVLMVVSGFRPWLRFEGMLFSAIEKAFMVYLFLASISEPWGRAYTVAFVVDLTIVLYSVVYFASAHGRPQRWKVD